MSAKPSPLNMADMAEELPRLVGDQVEVGRHAVHRVDHAAEVGTKKAFITLAEVRLKCTGAPAGMTSRLTLATCWAG